MKNWLNQQLSSRWISWFSSTHLIGKSATLVDTLFSFSPARWFAVHLNLLFLIPVCFVFFNLIVDAWFVPASPHQLHHRNKTTQWNSPSLFVHKCRVVSNDDLLKCHNIEKKNLSEILKNFIFNSSSSSRLLLRSFVISTPDWPHLGQSVGTRKKAVGNKNNQFHNWNTTLPVLFFSTFHWGER